MNVCAITFEWLITNKDQVVPTVAREGENLFLLRLQSLMLQQSQNSAEGLDESWEVASLQSTLGVQRCCWGHWRMVVPSSSLSSSAAIAILISKSGSRQAVCPCSLFTADDGKSYPIWGCLPHANLPGSTSHTYILLVVHISQHSAQLWMFAVLE